MVWLAGDLLMPERGMHAPGSFLANPAGLKHGPLLTARGSLLMLHCEAPMGAQFSELTNDDGEEVGAQLVADFHDGESWLETPRHTDWNQRREQPIYPSTTPLYAVPDDA